MSYSYINFKYPKVRQEEYSLIDKCNVHSATQISTPDPLINLPGNKNIALSFINLHHKTDYQIQQILLDNKFKTYHIFEVGSNSKPAYFLDNFITKYGNHHIGNYLNKDNFDNIKVYKIFNYKWYLPKDIAANYLFKLFNLSVVPSLEDLSILNYDGYTFDWQLHYIKLGQQYDYR